MPLIIICGLPSSGKTYRAKQIVDYFSSAAATSSSSSSSSSDSRADHVANGGGGGDQSVNNERRKRLKVHHVSDHSLHIARSVYGSARAEKDARAQLYAAAKRLLSNDDVVVLDSGNYIKGWRYQLHCEAKAVSTPCCVVHVGTPLQDAREINAQRRRAQQQQQQQQQRRHVRRAAEQDEANVGGGVSPAATDEEEDIAAKGDATTTSVEEEEAEKNGNEDGDAEQDAYAETTWDELATRFEEPNAMARWDSPLFTVVWDDQHPPYAQIWAALVPVGGARRSRPGAAAVAAPVRPNQATVLTPATKSDHLYELDRATHAVVARILEYQRDHPGERGGTVTITPSSLSSSRSPGLATGPAVVAAAVTDAEMDTDEETETSKQQQQQQLEINLPAAPLPMAQLQRLRRQFIALHRQQMGGLGMGAAAATAAASKGGGGGSSSTSRSGDRSTLNAGRVGELFVDWLNDSFERAL